MPDQTPRRGLAIGCGGTLGFAWTAAALQSLERELGWDARNADALIGTSAGSEMVAMLGAGRSTDAVVAALSGSQDDPVLADHVAQHPGMLPPVPRPGLPALGLLTAGLRRNVDATAALAGLLPKGRGDTGWLRTLGDRLADDSGWVSHPATWLVGADTKSGQRVAFGSPDAPKAGLGDAIAASWGIPGWFPPVAIGDRSYMDGGTVSTASADLLRPLGLDEVYILAPMASAGPSPATGITRVERVLRRRMSHGLDYEIDTLRADGMRVIPIYPSQEALDAMGANFMDLRRRDNVLATTLRTSPSTIQTALCDGIAACATTRQST